MPFHVVSYAKVLLQLLNCESMELVELDVLPIKSLRRLCSSFIWYFVDSIPFQCQDLLERRNIKLQETVNRRISWVSPAAKMWNCSWSFLVVEELTSRYNMRGWQKPMEWKHIGVELASSKHRSLEDHHLYESVMRNQPNRHHPSQITFKPKRTCWPRSQNGTSPYPSTPEMHFWMAHPPMEFRIGPELPFDNQTGQTIPSEFVTRPRMAVYKKLPQ